MNGLPAMCSELADTPCSGLNQHHLVVLGQLSETTQLSEQVLAHVMATLSVICRSAEQLHPDHWSTPPTNSRGVFLHVADDGEIEHGRQAFWIIKGQLCTSSGEVVYRAFDRTDAVINGD